MTFDAENTTEPITTTRRSERSVRAAAVHANLPQWKKDKILSSLRLGPARSAEVRKGKAFTDEHKKNLKAAKLGHTPAKRKIPLWDIAEDTLLGLSSGESGKKRGDSQGNVWEDRRSMGFPKGWPGTWRHGEVLVRRHIKEFCEDFGITAKDAASSIGFHYGWFTAKLNDDRPLSGRYAAPNKKKGKKEFPHIGNALRDRYNEFIERYCYDQTSVRWPVRNFLRSEIRDIPAKHAELTAALSSLGKWLRSDGEPKAPELIRKWMCEQARQETADETLGRSTDTKLRTLLFFGLSVKKLLNDDPKLFGAKFKPGKVASEILAIDYGAATGRIEAVVHGEVVALGQQGLALAIRATTMAERETAQLKTEIEKVRALVPVTKDPGRPPKAPGELKEDILRKRLATVRPLFRDVLAKLKARVSRDAIIQWLTSELKKCGLAYQTRDISDGLDNARSSRTPKAAARAFMQIAEHLSYSRIKSCDQQ